MKGFPPTRRPCRTCGHPCAEDVDFCPECGAGVPSSTPEALLSAKTTLGEGLDDHDLAGQAATAAAKILSVNWAAALSDGTPVQDVLHDVDDVAALLAAWRQAVLESFGNAAA